jgi:hypothetical protein
MIVCHFVACFLRFLYLCRVSGFSRFRFLGLPIVGFLFDATKSIPITHLLLNSNLGFQVYIRGLLFRYVISKFRLREVIVNG